MSHRLFTCRSLIACAIGCAALACGRAGGEMAVAFSSAGLEQAGAVAVLGDAVPEARRPTSGSDALLRTTRRDRIAAPTRESAATPELLLIPGAGAARIWPSPKGGSELAARDRLSRLQRLLI